MGGEGDEGGRVERVVEAGHGIPMSSTKTDEDNPLWNKVWDAMRDTGDATALPLLRELMIKGMRV